MNALDLFSGIGGFSLGLERAGMRTVAFCESDVFCRAVLRKHWPHIPCFDDVRTLDAGRLGGLGRIDLVCGGFPCQPFSHAGRQRAQADDRYLWPAMREVIALARPAWVVGENVTGIITLALDDVLADLEGLGYATRPFVIPAVAVDAIHRRDRVWIIARDANVEGKSIVAINDEVARMCSTAANSNGSELRNQSGRSCRTGGASEAQPRNDGPPWTLAESAHEGTRRRSEFEEGGEGERDVANTTSNGWRQGRSQGARENERPGSSGSCRWLPEPDVGRVADGVSRRMDRLRALGNAVVPQVVEEIGRAIMRCAQ